MDESTKELDELNNRNLEELELMTKNKKSCTDTLLDCGGLVKPPSFNDSNQNIEALPTSKSCSVFQYVGHTTCLPEVANEVKEEADEAVDLTSYETSEVSVSAEIRLSPLPNVGSESNELDVSETLPVLDLLELNNHVLRLTAATRDSTLDRFGRFRSGSSIWRARFSIFAQHGVFRCAASDVNYVSIKSPPPPKKKKKKKSRSLLEMKSKSKKRVIVWEETAPKQCRKKSQTTDHSKSSGLRVKKLFVIDNIRCKQPSVNTISSSIAGAMDNQAECQPRPGIA
ncbi:uncharacterized protein LOC130699881 [Daphnia carinata]|uniref:uncharacterized protein LOC130699881 n=1 Tax=Daphnia carinata TaxID=120202 RepID=UPI00257FE154|nr:uncharacterized protein LOC130699881 [Daphnia carinata]